MNQKKIKAIVWLVLALGIIGYFISVAYQMYRAFNESNGVSDLVSREYIELFPNKYRDRFTNEFTYKSKVRSDFSAFDLDNYRLLIYKLPTLKSESLIKMIKLREGDASESIDHVYANVGQNCLSVQYNTGKPSFASQLFLTLYGKSLKVIIENDSIVSYSLILNNLSLKYKIDGDVDFFAKSDIGSLIKESLIPVNISFVRKKQGIYFIIMLQNDCTIPMKNSNLTEVLNGTYILK